MIRGNTGMASSAIPYLKIIYPIQTWASHHAWAPTMGPRPPPSKSGAAFQYCNIRSFHQKYRQACRYLFSMFKTTRYYSEQKQQCCTVSKYVCSTQEEILVSTEIEFDISLVLKKFCLRKLATSPRKLLYYLAAVRSLIDADKARTVDKQLVTDFRKTSF